MKRMTNETKRKFAAVVALLLVAALLLSSVSVFFIN